MEYRIEVYGPKGETVLALTGSRDQLLALGQLLVENFSQYESAKVFKVTQDRWLEEVFTK